MTARPPDFSEAFAATALEEAERLRVRAHELRLRGTRWIERGEQTVAEAERLETRVRELDEMLGRAPQLRIDLQSEQLRGQQLRKAAIQILVERVGTRRPIHYRDWYRLLTETGRAAAGRDPLATFLTQITRSPLVQRVEARSGVYQLDPGTAYQRARAELAAAARNLRQVQDDFGRTTGSASGDGEAGITVRDAAARVARAQRELDAVVEARSLLLRERLSA